MILTETDEDDSSVELQKLHTKMLEQNKKSKEMEALKKIVEPLTDALSELSITISDFNKVDKNEQKPEYFDKELSKSVTDSIDKVFALLQKFKQPNITVDLSPINALASEIKKGNDSLISLVGKLNNNGSPELERLLKAVANSQTILVEKMQKQTDIAPILQGIREDMNKKGSNQMRIENLTVTHGKYGDMIVTPNYIK